MCLTIKLLFAHNIAFNFLCPVCHLLGNKSGTIIHESMVNLSQFTRASIVLSLASRKRSILVFTSSITCYHKFVATMIRVFTFESESSRIESSRIESSRIEPSRVESWGKASRVESRVHNNRVRIKEAVSRQEKNNPRLLPLSTCSLRNCRECYFLSRRRKRRIRTEKGKDKEKEKENRIHLR